MSTSSGSVRWKTKNNTVSKLCQQVAIGDTLPVFFDTWKVFFGVGWVLVSRSSTNPKKLIFSILTIVAGKTVSPLCQ